MKDDEYSLSLYWTRLQVGVKNKALKRQVWCTPASLDASFENKILLANEVVPRFSNRFLNPFLRQNRKGR